LFFAESTASVKIAANEHNHGSAQFRAGSSPNAEVVANHFAQSFRILAYFVLLLLGQVHCKACDEVSNKISFSSDLLFRFAL
jgi:hypothetical protein